MINFNKLTDETFKRTKELYIKQLEETKPIIDRIIDVTINNSFHVIQQRQEDVRQEIENFKAHLLNMLYKYSDTT